MLKSLKNIRYNYLWRFIAVFHFPESFQSIIISGLWISVCTWFLHLSLFPVVAFCAAYGPNVHGRCNCLALIISTTSLIYAGRIIKPRDKGKNCAHAHLGHRRRRMLHPGRMRCIKIKDIQKFTDQSESALAKWKKAMKCRR